MPAQYKPFPSPIPFKKLLGPSFIILALGLGSGEVILWPYLTANYGLGIAWGALLGITFQYFINMEIERYALVTGESVFVGLYRQWKWVPYWFILSTFIGFGLPGIIAASAEVFAHIIGVEDFTWIGIGFLLLIGIIISIGKTVYTMMEHVTKTILLVGVPCIFLLTIFLTTGSDWLALFQGLAGRGEGYAFFPSGMSLAAFFAAFAYSGAGGNLNLTQSIYIKEKGYGMGKYSQKIAGLFHTKKEEAITLTGTKFVPTQENIARFRAWWRIINKEHALVFWGIGTLSIMLLMLLAYTTTYGLENNVQGIRFVINEGAVIGQALSPIIGTLFLLIVSIMLFQTELGVLDSTSRIMAENVALLKTKAKKNSPIHLSKIYFTFLWAQIAFGCLLFLLKLTEPRSLLVLGAVINAIAMFVHIGLVNWMNKKELPTIFHPHWFRKVMIVLAFIVFGLFSILTVGDKIFK